MLDVDICNEWVIEVCKLEFELRFRRKLDKIVGFEFKHDDLKDPNLMSIQNVMNFV